MIFHLQGCVNRFRRKRISRREARARVGIHIRLQSEARLVPLLEWKNIIASVARFVYPRERVDGGAEEITYEYKPL